MTKTQPRVLLLFGDITPDGLAAIIRRLCSRCALIIEGVLYGAGRSSAAGRTFGSRLVDVGLHALHAGGPAYSDDSYHLLREACGQMIPLSIAEQGSSEAKEFLARFRPDVVVSSGCGNLADSFVDARQILLWTEDVPADDKSIRGSVRVHLSRDRADAEDVVETASFRRDPLDTRLSLALKANLLRSDLLVREFSRLKPQAGTSDLPPLWQVSEVADSVAQPPVLPQKWSRPGWRLAAKAALATPGILRQNRQSRRTFDNPVTVLYHHLVSDRPHYMGISTEDFYRQARFLQRNYRLSNLTDIVSALRSGKTDPGLVVLTWDDGYRDNYLCLRAVCEELDVPSTLFLCSGIIDAGGEFEHDVCIGVRDFPALTWEQVVEFERSGFELGAHTRSHFDCGATDQERLHSEIVGSKTDLEKILKRPMPLFSFPWGHRQNMSPSAVALAKANFEILCSAYGGRNQPGGYQPGAEILRCGHPGNLLELELTLQGALDPQRED